MERSRGRQTARGNAAAGRAANRPTPAGGRPPPRRRALRSRRLCADSDADLVRLAVRAVRKEVRDTVPIVVAMEEVDLQVINIAIRCGADALVLRPFGADFVTTRGSMLAEEPLFFGESSAVRPRRRRAITHRRCSRRKRRASAGRGNRRRAAAAAAGVTGTDCKGVDERTQRAALR